LKQVLLILLLLATNLYFGQDLNISVSGKDIRVSKAAEKTPSLLVKELTEGKTSDKEKFDRIFAWVATNIRYNYAAYFSMAGSPLRSDISSILASKRAICVGYSHLMDTLCKLAGITNTTIFGYAREELSDVGDSVYVDNHAWNAVKLDGLWYVYDATWSTGDYDYVLNKWNRWKSKIRSNFKFEYKKKKIRPRTFKGECKSYTSPPFYYKQKFLNKVKLWFVSLLKVNGKWVYINEMNSSYYLCEPELFSVTHFPDDPVWSLTQNRSFKHFENDTAWYHHHDTLYKYQVRSGRECIPCDEHLEKDTYRQMLAFKQNSTLLNPKNEMSKSISNYMLCRYNENLARNNTDSATQVMLLDSAIYYNSLFRNYAARGKLNVIKEFVQLKNKNKTKANLLFKENKGHLIFAKSKVKLTLTQNRAFNAMFSKGSAMKTNYRKQARRLKKVVVRPLKGPANANSKMVEQAKKRFDKTLEKVDSLNILLDTLKKDFEYYVVNLSLNIWQQSMNHDTVTRPYLKRTILRARRRDNYKKDVVELTKYLFEHEQKYAKSINSVVYRPAAKSMKLFNEIILLLNYKYNLERQCLSNNMMLYRWEEMSKGEFDSYRDKLYVQRKDDYCWLESYLPHVYVIGKGMKVLSVKQRILESVIVDENKTERYRHYGVNQIYTWRMKKYKNINTQNARVGNIMDKSLKKQRRAITRPGKKRRVK
jgi:hypothetical protein